MKQTEIDYSCRKGIVTIHEIRNVATFKDIVQEFGADTARKYTHTLPNYVCSLMAPFPATTLLVMIAYKQGTERYVLILSKGLTMHKNKFQELISVMKQAGANLTEGKKPEVKTVKI